MKVLRSMTLAILQFAERSGPLMSGDLQLNPFTRIGGEEASGL